MQKTLGGDRLGAGKKMKVELHNYERSTHNIGYIWRSTMSAGTLVPFMSEIALPGTTFDINLECDVKTHPTVGPLFGSYKVQLDTFLVPIRLYNALLHNNQLGIGRQMSAVKLPQIELTALPIDPASQADLDNTQINPSALPAYLGIRGIGLPGLEPQTRQFNAIPILAYWEIYKNYYANKQEEIGAVIHNNNTPIDAADITGMSITSPTATVTNIIKVPPGALQNIQVPINGYVLTITTTLTEDEVLDQVYLLTNKETGTIRDLVGTLNNTGLGSYQGTIKPSHIPLIIQGWNTTNIYNLWQVEPRVQTFELANIDAMRNAILTHTTGTPLIIDNTSPEPYKWLADQPNTIPNLLSSQEGLALKTYQSDLLNNWLKTENIEAISTATAVDTSAGSFTIDTLVISKKVWNMLQRINVSGGSYDDWMDAVYVHERYKSQESPMYMGGLIKELVFQEVVSNSESESGQPLGTLAGKGVLGQKHKGGKVVIHVDEPSYVMGIISITPRLDYSQGNKWDIHIQTMDDLHKPALDEIGFQELITEQMAWWNTSHDGTEWVQKSAGKQPAWINYMTNLNQTRGNFAIRDNEMFMTLNRRYEYEHPDTIRDLTTYIDPAKFNFIFAETALDAQNFWAQIAVDITARRKMSGKLMPNL